MPRSMKNKFWLFDWEFLSREYAKTHATRGNQMTHTFGIPMIVLALVYWTRYPSGSPLTLLAVFLPVYFLWEVRLGVMMSLLLFAFGRLAQVLPPWSAWALFVVGWVFQLVGHEVYEKKKPAFTDNLVHLLVGPAWILEKWRRRLVR